MYVLHILYTYYKVSNQFLPNTLRTKYIITCVSLAKLVDKHGS